VEDPIWDAVIERKAAVDKDAFDAMLADSLNHPETEGSLPLYAQWSPAQSVCSVRVRLDPPVNDGGEADGEDNEGFRKRTGPQEGAICSECDAWAELSVCTIPSCRRQICQRCAELTPDLLLVCGKHLTEDETRTAPLGNQAPGRLVVSIGSKGFRRLHQHLHCYLRPGVHYHRFEFGDDFDEMEFNSLCKLCWPWDMVEAQQKDDLWVDVGEPDSCSAPCTSSSSDSSSSSSPMPCSRPPSRELARLALTRLT
jgi:hypothetical protein